MDTFGKSFTQQEAIPEDAIERAVAVLRSGRLHRYNTDPGVESEAALLEREFAAYQGAGYCVATTSGGTAIQISLRAIGVERGDKVLANAYTLAPVPGAIHNVGAQAVLVDIDRDYHVDLDDLRDKAANSGARAFLLSHMRGHISDMDAIVEICRDANIELIEDCAHTMGARWSGTRSGNFGTVACFSTQTYKHMNSGEGGFITTDDPEIAARAVLHSGSYMFHDRHGTPPQSDVFDSVKFDSANFSSRMDNLRAAILRAQLPNLDANIARWNALYRVLDTHFRNAPGIEIPERQQHEFYVGSSIQFRPERLSKAEIPGFIARCGSRGVDLKWFGEDVPRGFTSRYDSWRYLGEQPILPGTLSALEKTCDMRVPLTFTDEDCHVIGTIIAEEVIRS
ncbi:MAG: DegT/DnrJ/EryC1/StrS family aminotransferase [Pseudomonadota bacterium]